MIAGAAVNRLPEAMIRDVLHMLLKFASPQAVYCSLETSEWTTETRSELVGILGSRTRWSLDREI